MTNRSQKSAHKQAPGDSRVSNMTFRPIIYCTLELALGLEILFYFYIFREGRAIKGWEREEKKADRKGVTTRSEVQKMGAKDIHKWAEEGK